MSTVQIQNDSHSQSGTLPKGVISLELQVKNCEDEKRSIVETQKKFLDGQMPQIEYEENLIGIKRASMTNELISDDDIIRLNVGGENFNTRRDTLCCCPHSVLASMFSGRWEQSLPKLEDGRFFLDYDPECFKEILNHLRLMRLTQSRTFSVPQSFKNTQEKCRFCTLAKYLGLFIESPIPCFEPSDGVRISNNGRTSQNSGSKTYQFVQTSILHFVDDYPLFWKLRVKALTCTWVFVGIISQNTKGPGSYASPSSYGWGSSGYCYVNGKHDRNGDGLGTWRTNDEVIMKLDPLSGCLQMKHDRLSKTFQLEVGEAPKEGWRIHINYGPNNIIELGAVSDHEVF